MEKLKTSAGRKYHLDLLKAIAIFSVAFYHLTTYECDILQTGSVGDYLRYLGRPILSTCVPLFFFVNGYLLLNRPLDLRRHIVRIVKMVILTFVWGMIGIPGYIMTTGAEMTGADFFTNLWRWLPNKWINHLWYMGALVCIYVFLPLIKLAFDHDRKIFNYLTVFAVAFTFGNTVICDLITIFGNCFFGMEGIFFDNIFNFFNPFRNIYGYSFVYFCFGGHIAGKEEKLRNIPVRRRNLMAVGGIVAGSLLLWGLGVYYSHIGGSVWDVVWNGYDSIFTFAMTFCLYLLSFNYRGGCSIIEKVSANTLGIYFMHNIVLHQFRVQLWESTIGVSVLANAVCAVGIVLFCTAVSIVIKKAALFRWLV